MTLIPPFTRSPSRESPSTFSEDMDIRLSEENSRISAANTQANENNALAQQVYSNAKLAEKAKQDAQDSATTATAKAALAQAVVIPTNATYSLTQLDTSNTMMSKAAFNALASERRANRAGSGADEMGKGNATTALNVNEGIHTSTTMPNTFYLGKVGGIGISKTDAYIASINGSIIACKYINTSTADATLLVPPAPTVLPYDVTLTTEQIAMGVIKHADASNSGLIVNGRFNTDTSGWSATNGAVLSIDSNRLKITPLAGNAYGAASQGYTTVVGKSYIVELDISVTTLSSIQMTGMTPISYTASDSGRKQFTFIATATTTTITLVVNNNTGTPAYYDNIALFPSDAISRSDLAFLESWHEDVSEKDFVYPLGNVQYLGGVTDGMGAIVSGAFSGSNTYSLFGNWQASGALVGKGYVWSGMSDAQKKAFVSNPENNCYLDGDKTIQVRYRMRVVAGIGDSWYSTNSIQTTSGGIVYTLKFNNTGVSANDSYVVPTGKSTTIKDLNVGYLNGMYYDLGSSNTTYNKSDLNYIGAFQAVNFGFNLTTTFGYDNKCFALPIALVHRRNQGGYDAIYNPNGARTITMTPTCIADCFNPSNYNASTGYIGTSTLRPDGLFYDQVSTVDFKPSNKGADLRNTTKKRTAQSLIEEFAPKVITGTLLYNNNDTTALTTYKDFMEVRDTSGNRYPMKNKIGNVVTINDTVANKKGFSIVTQNGKQYLQVADDAASDATVQMNLSVTKYDLGVFDA